MTEIKHYIHLALPSFYYLCFSLYFRYTPFTSPIFFPPTLFFLSPTTLFPSQFLGAEHIGMLQSSGPACISVMYVASCANGFSRRVWVALRCVVHPFPCLMGPPGRGCMCVFVCETNSNIKVGRQSMRQSQRKTSFL